MKLICVHGSEPKVGQSTVNPKGISKTPKGYSCVIWLKSVHYFQNTGPEKELDVQTDVQTDKPTLNTTCLLPFVQET